jgi:hypothetical protein
MKKYTYSIIGLAFWSFYIFFVRQYLGNKDVSILLLFLIPFIILSYLNYKTNPQDFKGAKFIIPIILLIGLLLFKLK